MLAVNVILKNQVQKRTFIVIDKSMVEKLQRTFVKFVTVNTNPKQWHGGSEAAGEAARLMAPPPPPVILFLPLGLGRILGTRVMS